MSTKKNVSYLLLLILSTAIKVIHTRTYLTPYMNQWNWYNYHYPLMVDEEKHECGNFIAGISLFNRNAFTAWTDQCSLQSDFATLLHGYDDFRLSDIYNVEGLKYDYVLNPAYRLDKSTVNLQFEYIKNDKWDTCFFTDCPIDIKVRCKIPIHSQIVTNLNSATMIFNTVEKQSKSNPNKAIRKKSSEFIKKMQTRDANNFSLKTEDGKSVFAVRFDYISEKLSDETFIVENNETPIQVLCVMNNNLPAYSWVDSNGNQLTINDLLSNYCLESDSNSTPSPLHYEQASTGDSQTDIITFSDSSTRSVFYTNPLGSPAPTNGGAVLPLYLYTQESDVFYTIQQDQNSFQLPLMAGPDFVSDPQYGDNIALRDIIVGNAYTDGTVNNAKVLESKPIKQNSIIRLLSTGQYNNGVYNRSAISFFTPPVCVQKISSPQTFPDTYGVSPALPDHEYSTTNNALFIPYDTLTLSGDTTLLKEDGTFLDPSKPKAVLWYAYNYSPLFNSSDYQDVRETLFLTTSLDSNGSPTEQSSSIYTNLANQGDNTDARLTKLEKYMFGANYSPGITDSSNQTTGLQYDMYLNNDSNGNPSYALAMGEYTETLYEPSIVQSKILNIPYNINTSSPSTNNPDDESRLINKKPVNTKKNINKTKSSSSGSYFVNESLDIPMQYNEFQQNGIGNIDLEVLLGSYTCLMNNNDTLVNLFLGLELPTASSINCSDSFLAIPIENNGHYMLKFGCEGAIDFCFFKDMRLNIRTYFEHAFKTCEKIIPRIEGYDVYGFVPFKVDADVSWNTFLWFSSLNIYASDFSGFTFGYQYWKKFHDSIKAKNLFEIGLAGTKEMPTVTNLEGCNGRGSHTLSASFFSRVTQDCTISLGCSRTIKGFNTADVMDIYGSIGIDF